MSRRFLTQKDLSAAKHKEEIINSKMKRGEIIDQDKIVKRQHVVCGCGAVGCIFISFIRKSEE